MMFAMISPVDMVVVVGVALVVFGPKRLPEVARQLGTFVREARSMMSHFTDSFEGIGHEVRSVSSLGDNVMRPLAPTTAPKLVPFDQREVHEPPSLQAKQPLSVDYKTALPEEPSVGLRLTDISVDKQPLQHGIAADITTHSEQHRAAELPAQPHEANNL